MSTVFHLGNDAKNYIKSIDYMDKVASISDKYGEQLDKLSEEDQAKFIQKKIDEMDASKSR